MGKRGRPLSTEMHHQSHLLARPDRPDCVRFPKECRSPYACASIGHCADTLTPAEDDMAFGWGSGTIAAKSGWKRKPESPRGCWHGGKGKGGCSVTAHPPSPSPRRYRQRPRDPCQ